MKKSLLALAVLGAFAGAAQAQTSVTLYGSIDAGLRYINPDVGDDSLGLNGGIYNSNRIGFRGVEDLGGGMNAHFTLETGFSENGVLDNGITVAGRADPTSGLFATSGTARIFNRSAYVGLGGSWGTLDLGRQYSVNFKTIGSYDPFIYKYSSIIPVATIGGLTRLDNNIQYTGNFGPVVVRAEYALGEVAGSIGDGSTAAIGGTFKTGAFNVGAAYTQREVNVGSSAAPVFRDRDVWTVGGAWGAGPFRVALGYSNDEQDATVAGGRSTEIENAWIGGSYSISPAFAVQAAYYRTEVDVSDVERNLFILGTTYAISKRTNFYAEVDYTEAEARTAAGLRTDTSTTGFSVGVNHLF
jgi:predicted porin